MAVLRPTYPTKTNNPSDPLSTRQWQYGDANQVKQVLDNHADNLDYILNVLGLGGTNSIGTFISLSAIQAAYPDGADGSYGIIDDGLGGTPNIATYNDGTSMWELAVPDQSIIWVANVGALPGTGVAQKLYIALDSGFMYKWNGSGYDQIGSGGDDIVVKYIENNGTHYRTEKGYGNTGSGHEADDVIDCWYDSNKERWIRAVVLNPPLTLPQDFDDSGKTFLITDKLKLA